MARQSWQPWQCVPADGAVCVGSVHSARGVCQITRRPAEWKCGPVRGHGPVPAGGVALAGSSHQGTLLPDDHGSPPSWSSPSAAATHSPAAAFTWLDSQWTGWRKCCQCLSDPQINCTPFIVAHSVTPSYCAVRIGGMLGAHYGPRPPRAGKSPNDVRSNVTFTALLQGDGWEPHGSTSAVMLSPCSNTVVIILSSKYFRFHLPPFH